MTAADKIVKKRLAEERAAKEAEYLRWSEDQVGKRANLHSEINDFVAKIVPFARQHNYPGIQPIRLRRYRFPPLGDLFGYFETTKGGWPLGSYGMQSLDLLADGRILWEGMPSRLSKIEHCVPVVRNGVRELWEHLNADGEGDSWKPPRVTIGP